MTTRCKLIQSYFRRRPNQSWWRTFRDANFSASRGLWEADRRAWWWLTFGEARPDLKGPANA